MDEARLVYLENRAEELRLVGSGVPELVAEVRRLLSFEAVVKAARPLADLPIPLSADERDQWRVHQQVLIAALAAASEQEAT